MLLTSVPLSRLERQTTAGGLKGGFLCSRAKLSPAAASQLPARMIYRIRRGQRERGDGSQHPPGFALSATGYQHAALGCRRVPGRKCRNSPAAPRHLELTGEGAPLTRIPCSPAVWDQRPSFHLFTKKGLLTIVPPFSRQPQPLGHSLLETHSV